MLDVKLSTAFRRPHGDGLIDPRDFFDYADFDINCGYYDMRPGEFVLARAANNVAIPLDRVGIIMPTSTYLRCGLGFGSGFVHAGWNGRLVLELKNLNPHRALRLYVGGTIAHIGLLAGTIVPYQGKYLTSNPMEPR